MKKKKYDGKVQNPILKESADTAYDIDKNYISKGKRLTKVQWEKLFESYRNLPDFDKNNVKFAFSKEEIPFDAFGHMLSEKARNIYNTKIPNTVHEYYKYGKKSNVKFRLFLYNIYERIVCSDKWYNKLLFTIFGSKFFSWLRETSGIKRDSVLVRFFGKTIIIDEDFDSFKESIQKVAGMFNYLVEEDYITHGTLMPLTIMPLHSIDHKRRAAILIYACSPYENDKINDKLGEKFAVNEGALPDLMVA